MPTATADTVKVTGLAERRADMAKAFRPEYRSELLCAPRRPALSSARALGVSLPNTATAQELFNSLAARGGSGWDHSAMIKALENLANFEIEPPKS